MTSGNRSPNPGMELGDAEGNATVTDSPAANRRERRLSGTPNPAFAAPGVPAAPRSGGERDAELAGSAVLSRSSQASGHPDVHQDEATRLHSKQVLFAEDVGLLRTFSALVGLLCLTIVLTLPFLRGNVILRSVLWGGSLFSIFTSLWIYIVLRDVSRYDQKLINISGLLSVFITFAGVLYLGVHSPGPLVILPGIYFVARTQTFPSAFAMYLLCALMQGVMAALILSGTIRDPGLITASEAELHTRVIIQALIQMLYVGTYLLARSGRFVTLAAMTKVIEAEAKAQQREAAFIEVREDLDRILGAGGVGHYTDQVFGAYKLGGIIGRGAMGEVYEAAHVQTGELAAAKVLHPHVLAKQSSVIRFLREAEAAGSLQSPHSVQVLAASRPDAPIPYLIMERLVGTDLANHLRKVRRMPIGELTTLVQQVGSVIDMAAAMSIVHRDLKPQNLFLSQGPTGPSWKVLDFGASKLAEHSGTLTQGRVIGTPSYMSPQQARGQDVDGAADRYCLAAIAYRALTGRPPFAGKDLPTTLYNVVYGTPPQPSVLADVDPALDLVLAIGMAKAPSKRFPTAAEFARALAAAGDGVVDRSLQAHAEAILLENPWGMLPNQKSE